MNKDENDANKFLFTFSFMVCSKNSFPLFSPSSRTFPISKIMRENENVQF